MPESEVKQLKSRSIVVAKQAALDQRWFDGLRSVDDNSQVVGLSRELFTVLGPSHRTLERYRKVYERIPFNPDLYPTDFGVPDVEALKKPLQQLKDLRQTIADTEVNTAIRQAYMMKIDEVLLQNDILIAAVNRDSAGFLAANQAIYGLPDRAIFTATCAWIRRHARGYMNSTSHSVAEAAAQVLESVPRIGGSAKRLVPRNAVFRRVQATHSRPDGYFSQLFGDTPLPEYVTAKEGDPVVKMAIKAIGLDYALADSSDELWGVVHHRNQVVRPAGYNLPLADFKGIVAHEVGSHLLERGNGQRQPLRLLEVGLDRYEAGNEGRAFLREQIMYASPYDMLQQSGWEYICLKHVAISLASGLHRSPYDFQELYETLYPVCLLFQTIRRPDNPVYAQTIARDETWHLLVRVLKGTDGFGGAYLKDIVYLEGNVKAWQMAAINPAYILYGDNGKFDISRAEHRKLLASFGIKPEAGSRFNLRHRFRRFQTGQS